MKFMIFAHARSGSTSLMEILRHHPKFRMISEPFNPNRRTWGRQYKDEFNNLESFDKTLKEVFKECNGFKHLIGQLPFCYVTRLLEQTTHAIFLRRENLLQAAVSSNISNQAGHWRRNRTIIESTNYTEVPIEGLLNTIKYWQKRILRFREALEEAGLSYVEITYEKLYGAEQTEKDKLENIQGMLKELGFSKIDPVSDKIWPILDSSSKLNNFKTYRLIPNIKEIAALGNDEIGYLFTGI